MAKKRATKAKAPAAKKAKTKKVEESKVVESPKLENSQELDENSEVDVLDGDEISEFAREVREEDKYNFLVLLLDQFDPLFKQLQSPDDREAEDVCSTLCEELYKCFKSFINYGFMVDSKDEKKNLVAAWLRDKYERYRKNLLWLVNARLSRPARVQIDALHFLLKLIKKKSEEDRKFVMNEYQDLLAALISSSAVSTREGETAVNHVMEEFHGLWAYNRDLQTYAFDDALAAKFEEWKNLEIPTKDKIFAHFYSLIVDGLAITDEEGEQDCYTSAYEEPDDDEFKDKYQKCFFAFMRMAHLDASRYKMILNSLHFAILPNLRSPTALMDILTDAFDQEEDEIVPLLVINSLWDLMREYNLEYPDFYTKLYSLLTPNLVYTRYRGRFFRQLDLFLSSTHLSANLVASFIKRLARIATTASAPGVVIIFPFIYNLLKRHPSCMIMLQNLEGSKDPNYKDPFKEKETNPQKTGAIGSSLWELETLQSHYHPNIATLAKIFSEPFRKPNYNMEDFLDWTYKSLLDSEEKRRYKGLAALEYEDWETLFGGENAFIEGWEL